MAQAFCRGLIEHVAARPGARIERWGHKMPDKFARASICLRTAKLSLEEAGRLIAASGAVETKNGIYKALSCVEALIETLDRQSAARPV